MTTTAYLRISTDQQDQQSQRQQIDAYAAAAGLTIDGYLADTASGSTPWQSRAIAPLIKTGAPGDTIIVSEISRVARSVVGVLTALTDAAERGITVVAVKGRLILDGTLPAKIVITMLALAAEIERDLIRERTKAALAARKANGITLGRPLGARSASKLQDRREEIIRCLAAKVSKRAIARMLDVAPGTLYAWLARDLRNGADPLSLPLPLEQ